MSISGKRLANVIEASGGVCRSITDKRLTGVSDVGGSMCGS